MGQQMAFIVIIVLCVMIFAQILIVRSDLQKKFDSLHKELYRLRRIIGKET